MSRQFYIVCILLQLVLLGRAQEVYQLDPRYPVHDLNTHLRIACDSTTDMTVTRVLQDTLIVYQDREDFPRRLKRKGTYWGILKLQPTDTLNGWTLHLQDSYIGAPAWTKSNGRVDVMAFSEDGKLIFHKKTGVEYPQSQRDIPEKWVLNRVTIDDLPVGQITTMIIKVKPNSFGSPPFFQLTARSPAQPYYHEVYQKHNSFNLFMFGVTFIILLYHLLQYLYVRDSVYLWFSLWLLFCCLTMAMSVGFIIGDVTEYRYAFWMIMANSIYFSFWFFGRSFIKAKEKFPKLDKLILYLAYIVMVEVAFIAVYTSIVEVNSFSIVWYHYPLLGVYSLIGLGISVWLLFQNDPFAKYFGVGGIVGGLTFAIGSLWSANLIKVPLDPYAWGMFSQIVIYSFGIAYRRQYLLQQSYEEKLKDQHIIAEMERKKDLEEIKTRFYANISHEFRTPLALISGPMSRAKQRKEYHENIENQDFTITPKEYEIISNNTERLEKLVNQLLELSQLDSGLVHLQLSQGGIIRWLRAIANSFESMAESKNIHFHTNFPQEVLTAYYDKDKLEKIMYNLLSNAFKYSSAGGSVGLEVTHDQNTITISVEDSGPGIAHEDVQRIFDRFYRVAGTETNGSGIGLALTKELIDAHNGAIYVNSMMGKGTKFKVTLPTNLNDLPKDNILINSAGISEPTTSSSSSSTSKNPQRHSPVIGHVSNEMPIALIVEDNNDLRAFIAEGIADGYEVLLSGDGAQGARMAIEHIPDIIITDVMMPVKDGYQLCHELKSNSKTCHIPIIMLTAKASQEDKIQGLYQGADAYLPKPYDEQELLLLMGNMIQSRKNIWDSIKDSGMLMIPNLEMGSMDDEFLQKVTTYIKEHISDDQFSVDDLASGVGYSRSQLHRKLKALLNKSANQLIKEMRLTEAYRILSTHAGTVSEAAYSVGYTNMSHFTKSFKELHGILPSRVNDPSHNIS